MSVPYGSDPWLDARLRNVPLPAGMLARLNQLAKDPGDDATKAAGSESAGGPKLYRPNQPVPIGPGLSDDQMDMALVDVPLPLGMRKRLERISLEPRPRIAGRHMAIAASVLLAMGVGYFSRSIFLGTDTSDVPGEMIADVEPDRGAEIAGADTDDVPDDDTLLADDEFVIHPSIDELRWEIMKLANEHIASPDQILSPSSPAERPNKESIFGLDRVFDGLPELDRVDAGELSRGIEPPLTPGYDIRFLARHGQHPFVVPAAHKELQSLKVPLVTSSASYQHAWQALVLRKLPAASDVRVEEFLAAVDYDFPPAAPGSLALCTAAGPSPFAEPGTGVCLLQVAVQAGPLVPQLRPETLLTVVIDTSTGMRREGRLAMARRALGDLASQLTSTDRLTLVATSGDARLLVEAAGSDQLSSILAAIQSLEPERVTNPGAGLEAAYQATLRRQFADGETRRMVLVTGGLADLSDAAIGRIETLVADAAGKGVTLHVLQVGAIVAERDQQALHRISASGGGHVLKVDDADGARFALLETLTGRNQVVAREASMRISFNPQAVAAYRLLGHEKVALTGSTAAPSAVEMRAKEAATALVELRLNPQGGDELASIELTWKDAASGEQRSAQQQITRQQIAKSFAEGPPALQSATIVAYAAEVLRGSYFTAGNKSLGPVLDLAAQASPLVVDRPEMRVFLSFVGQAEKTRARTARRPK